MDERKNQIKAFERKALTSLEGRNKLLEELGETLLNRIGDENPFGESSGDTPGGVIADYRKLQKEISDSSNLITSLEADIVELKKLEDKISAVGIEHSRLEEELEEVQVKFGTLLLKTPYSGEFSGPLKQQEEEILEKIEDYERKLEELEGKQGGLIAWVGNNTKIAFTKTLLSKSRTSLDKLYHNAGKKYISGDPAGFDEVLEGQAAEAADQAFGLRDRMSSLTSDLNALKEERRKIGDKFGADGSPSKRIHGLERHIAHVKNEFPGIHLRLGTLAANNEGRAALSSFVREEDLAIFVKAEELAALAASDKLEIEKIKTSLEIDKAKAEIDKIKRTISLHRQKISSIEGLISGHEKEILQLEENIEKEMKFIEENGGLKGDIS